MAGALDVERGMRHLAAVEEEARRLVERLGGRWTPAGGMCRCPAHDDRTPSLSVRPGRRRLLLHCFAGCEAPAILRALDAGRLLELGAPPPAVSFRPAGRSWRGEAALRLWGDSRPIAGTPAEAYLQRRGLGGGSGELRYHPRTPFGSGSSTKFRRALIAAVRDETGVVAIHRTLLGPDSGAAAGRHRLRFGLGRFGQGAVRLGGTAPRLGLAEGIETALSASALFGLPCWATLGAERFASVALPAEVRDLVLFLDRDQGGRRAEWLARRAFAHLDGIEVRYPARSGEDWNDVLRRTGPGAARPPPGPPRL